MSDVAQFLWVEGTLSKLEQLCLRSFLDNNYEVHLYHYGDLKNVPANVRLIDGREILSEKDVFTAPGVTGRSFAGFSDRFRYHLLAARGGWWFDLDFVCIRHLPEPTQLTFASTWEGKWGECANGCAMWSQPMNPHMVRLRDRCENQISSGDIPFGSIGPFLVQRYVKEFELNDHVAPWWEFCPVPWRQISGLAPRNFQEWMMQNLRFVKHRIWEIFGSKIRAARFRGGSRAVHLHNEIWHAAGLHKDECYFHLSTFERLKRRHLEKTKIK